MTDWIDTTSLVTIEDNTTITQEWMNYSFRLEHLISFEHRNDYSSFISVVGNSSELIINKTFEELRDYRNKYNSFVTVNTIILN